MCPIFAAPTGEQKPKIALCKSAPALLETRRGRRSQHVLTGLDYLS